MRGLRKPSGNIITTVFKFIVSGSLIEELFSMIKTEDVCFSHGLGDKGGKGMALFNADLVTSKTSYRIVLVISY